MIVPSNFFFVAYTYSVLPDTTLINEQNYDDWWW